MRQGNYDQAETTFQEAPGSIPKFWNARFKPGANPVLQKRLGGGAEALRTAALQWRIDLAKEASQLIQYKILSTYLMEGKGHGGFHLAKLELSPDPPVVDYVKAAVALQHEESKGSERLD